MNFHDLPGDGYQRPRDPAEIWLARQWQRVLGFTVGTGESFFGVGGNSLDAARVIDAIVAGLGVQLPLNALAEHPTIERLAPLIRGQAGLLDGPLITIQDGDGARPPLFLVHPDHGHAAPYCHLAYALGEDYPVTGVQAAGLDDGAEPRRAIAGMAAAYASAIRAAHPGPCYLAGAGIGAAIACEIAAGPGDVRLLAVISDQLLEPPHASAGQPPGQPGLPQVLAAWQERGLIPPGTAPGFTARTQRVWQASQDAIGGWQPPPYTGPIHLFGPPPPITLPATATARTHQCGTTEDLASALRELLG